MLNPFAAARAALRGAWPERKGRFEGVPISTYTQSVGDAFRNIGDFASDLVAPTVQMNMQGCPLFVVIIRPAPAIALNFNVDLTRRRFEAKSFAMRVSAPAVATLPLRHCLRSSALVLRCVEDYLAGRRYPLELIEYVP